MKEQLKWADVAHMYINAGVRSNDGHMLVECRDGQNLWQYHDEGVQDFPFELPSGDLPILRHLEDMTEADAEDLYKFIHGDDGGEYNAYRCLQWAKQVFKRQDFTPLIVYWLISRGFDIYQLIESGEAIRKEASNG